jgi:8-oxo-dGTP diphosphatase
MRRAVRAVIIQDGQLLVMHRNKFGTEYDTLPGGGMEMGESLEDALVREIAEETSITFTNPRLVIVEDAGLPYGTQYVYLCDYASGHPQLSQDSEEERINRLGKNLYEPRWVKIADLSGLPFLSEGLKSLLLQYMREGFPQKPQQI